MLTLTFTANTPNLLRWLTASDPTKAAPGTIRGDYGLEIGRNLVHGSDSVESGEREVGLFFASGEVLDVKLAEAVDASSLVEA